MQADRRVRSTPDAVPRRAIPHEHLAADIEKVALLARLQLTENELETMTDQLAQIVGYVDQLAEVNTEGVEPMAHAIEVDQRVRGRSRSPQPAARRGARQRAASRRPRLSGAGRARRIT